MTHTPAPPSLLDLDLGFLALPRRLCTSAFFQSLRPDERWVFVQAMLAARYAEGGEFWFAGQRIPLAPGQFIETEQQIAAAAGSTRKTVRTVYRKATAAGLITRARVTRAGQCPSVTTILDYERIRLGPIEAGPRNGQSTGHEGATKGPADGPLTGHEGAPSEQGNPGEPGEPGDQVTLLPSPPAPAARRGRKRSGSEADPRHSVFVDAAAKEFEELRPGARFDFNGHDGKELHDFLERQPDATAEEWRSVYRRALELGPKYPGTAKVAQALQRWNELIAAPAAPRANGAPVPAMAAGSFGRTGGF